jgi:D-alanine-D-alanine ligase
MKVTILYDLAPDGEEYPGAAAEEAERVLKRGKKLRRPKLDREEIRDALVKLGHEVDFHVLDGTTQSLQALARTKEELVFNLVESFAGHDTWDMHVAAWLELLGKRYTGADPQALHLAQDKALAKKVMSFHDLHTPFMAVSNRGRLDHAQDIGFPLIVKPLSEDGSIGIDVGAVVNSIKDLMERISYIHDEFDSPALIEEYIEGREIYVGVIGNESVEALPPVELDLAHLPDGVPKIAGYEVKFERSSELYRKTKSAVAEDLDETTTKALQNAACTAYRALGLRDYGRIDVRLAPDGRVFVIEANPNPWLSSVAEFAIAARATGRTYTRVIEEIVELAMKR